MKKIIIYLNIIINIIVNNKILETIEFKKKKKKKKKKLIFL